MKLVTQIPKLSEMSLKNIQICLLSITEISIYKFEIINPLHNIEDLLIIKSYLNNIKTSFFT